MCSPLLRELLTPGGAESQMKRNSGLSARLQALFAARRGGLTRSSVSAAIPAPRGQPHGILPCRWAQALLAGKRVMTAVWFRKSGP